MGFALAYPQRPLDYSGGIHQVFSEASDTVDLAIDRIEHP